MADNSELDKMRLAAMMNKSPATGGLKATNTVTPSFSMNTPIEQAYSRWKQSDIPFARQLRGEQVSPSDYAKDIAYQLENATKDPTSFMGTIKAVGNLNLVPRIAKETLKGPETQTLQSFMNQVKQIPGVTKEGLSQGAKELNMLDPNTLMRKSEFESYIQPSKYQKVDLATQFNDIREHYRDEVEDALDETDVFHRMGIPRAMHNDIANFMYGGEMSDLPKAAQKKLRGLGYFDMQDIEDAYMQTRNEMVDEGIQYVYEEANHDIETPIVGPLTYKHRGIQRIIPSTDTNHNYFEIGVTHPTQEGIPYRHYDGFDVPKGLVGHVRGSFINEDILNPTQKVVFPKNSMVIEEIQSDAQQNAKQTGPLHQVHGTLFKAAVQHALENGADTVYLPTANTIKQTRRYAPNEAPHLNIYDTDIIKEGLNPLLQIPGVKHSMTTDFKSRIMDKEQHFNNATTHAIMQTGLDPTSTLGNKLYEQLRHQGGYTEHGIAQIISQHATPDEYATLKKAYGEDTYGHVIGNPFTSIDSFTFLKDMDHQKANWLENNPLPENLQDNSTPTFHKIEFSPEAIEHILKGPGQTAPGYKRGGAVDMDKVRYALAMRKAEGGEVKDPNPPAKGTPLARHYETTISAKEEPALEAPMFSPDDLIGTGIGKGAIALGAGAIKNVVPKIAKEQAQRDQYDLLRKLNIGEGDTDYLAQVHDFTKKVISNTPEVDAAAKAIKRPMPLNLTPEEIAYRNEFEPGFFHGSTKPFTNLRSKQLQDPIFITKEPGLANQFAIHSMYDVPTGAVYPVSARLGKTWDYETAAGQKEIENFIKKFPLSKEELENLKSGYWHAVERPNFINFLKEKGYDSFATREGSQANNFMGMNKFVNSNTKSTDLEKLTDIKNYGIFDPARLRSPFAKFNPADKDVVNLSKAQGGTVHMAGGGQPNNKFSYASGLADLAGLDEEYYNANTIPLQHFDKSTEHNGPADAMRHMLFQAQITKNHSPTLAKIISQGHERLLDWGQPDAEQAMDFHNDALGREIGAKAKSIDEMTQMAKDAIMSGRAKVIGHDLPGKYYKLGGNVKNVSTNTGNHGNIALTTAQIRANLLRKKHG